METPSHGLAQHRTCSKNYCVLSLKNWCLKFHLIRFSWACSFFEKLRKERTQLSSHLPKLAFLIQATLNLLSAGPFGILAHWLGENNPECAGQPSPQPSKCSAVEFISLCVSSPKLVRGPGLSDLFNVRQVICK